MLKQPRANRTGCGDEIRVRVVVKDRSNFGFSGSKHRNRHWEPLDTPNMQLHREEVESRAGGQGYFSASCLPWSTQIERKIGGSS